MIKLLTNKKTIEKEICKTAKIFGEEYSVEIIYTKINNPELDLIGKTIKVYLPGKYKKLKYTGIVKIALEKMYDEIARVEIENVMEETRIMLNGLAPENYEIKRISNRLAKCISTEKTIIINPEIIKQKGEQEVEEGCLSFPNQFAKVIRPSEVTVKALDRDGKEYKLLNKCVNNYLINQNKSIEIGTINKIEKILSEFQEYDYKIIDSYLEINNYKIGRIEELIELMSNIEDYQIIKAHNNMELGKYIIDNLPDFDTPEYLYEFLDIEKLGKKFLTINNIKYSFCSNGVLLNTRLMLGNDLITGRIKKEHRIRLLVANKQMYKKDSSCKKIEILFPISEKKLQEKIELLDLKNDNIEIYGDYYVLG